MNQGSNVDLKAGNIYLVKFVGGFEVLDPLLKKQVILVHLEPVEEEQVEPAEVDPHLGAYLEDLQGGLSKAGKHWHNKF